MDIGGFPVSYQNDNIDIDIDSYCAPIIEGIGAVAANTHLLQNLSLYCCLPYARNSGGQSLRGGKPWYYMDDGVYGAFSGRCTASLRLLYTLHQPGAAVCFSGTNLR